MDDLDLTSIMVGYDEPTKSDPPPARAEPKPTPPMPEPSPAATSDEIQALITRCKLLFDTFPAKLKDIKPKKPLEKLSEEQLRDLNKNIDYILGAKTNVEAMAKTFPLMLKAVEELAAQFTPLRIQGTHAVCYEPEVQDMIKYTIIDSGLAGISSSPQQRLAFTIISSAMRQHTLNSALEAMTAEQKQAYSKAMNTAGSQQPPENDKYADL